MELDVARPRVGALAARWWTLVVRGVAAILFGVIVMAAPRLGLLALVALWGAYAIVDGAFNLMTAARGGYTGGRWGWLLFEGVVSIVAGVLTFVWPGITALVLLTVIAVWAVLTGIAEIAAAVRLRQHIRNEWMLVGGGIVSIAFGVILFVSPRTGALALVWTIGAYTIVFGALLIGVGVRLHRWYRAGEGAIPSAGATRPA